MSFYTKSFTSNKIKFVIYPNNFYTKSFTSNKIKFVIYQNNFYIKIFTSKNKFLSSFYTKNFYF